MVKIADYPAKEAIVKNGLLQASAAVAISGLCLVVSPAWATPTTYIYDQTSSSIPGFIATGTIVLDNAIASNFPVSNIANPGPYNFGSFLSLNLSLDGFNYSLSDFTPQNAFGFPSWTISTPFNIFFVDKNDGSDFQMNGGMISYNHDFGDICGNTGACKADGNWVAVPVPEPVTLVLFGSGLIGAVAMRRRKKKAA